MGASNYNNGWPKLPGVGNDIEALKKVLLKHGFSVSMIMDPDSAHMQTIFRKFIRDHGMEPQNRLLFYFAGHGHTIKHEYGGVTAYLVPVDAPNPNFDQKEFSFKAYPLSDIESMAKRIDAKHALFIFDSCFSGSIFALSRSLIPATISYKTSYPVREFITSGSADEEVPDKSIFLQELLKGLQGAGDVNHDGYITGSELGFFLNDKVVNYSHNSQHPQWGKIRNPKLDKGDFVFINPEKKESIIINPILPASPADELLFWDTIKNSRNPDDFKAYIEQYPNGRFLSLARIRTKHLTPEAPGQTFERLLKQADEQIAAGQLISPTGSNSLITLRKAWNINPGNKGVKKRLHLLLARIQAKADTLLTGNNFEQAKEVCQQGIKIAKVYQLPADSLHKQQTAIQNRKNGWQQYTKYLQKASDAWKTKNTKISRKFLGQAAKLAEKHSFSMVDIENLQRKIERNEAENELERLLKQADEQIAAGRLISPSGSNGLATLRKAWNISSGNKRVKKTLRLLLAGIQAKVDKLLTGNNFEQAEKICQQGITIGREFQLPADSLHKQQTAIQNRKNGWQQYTKYLQKASDAWKTKNTKISRKFLGQAAKLAEKHSFSMVDIENLQRKIERNEAENELERLLKQADGQIAAGRLISPSGSNSLATLRKAWNINPGNKGVKKSLGLLLARIQAKADKLLTSNNFGQAKEVCQQGIKIARAYELPADSLHKQRAVIQNRKNGWQQYTKYLENASAAWKTKDSKTSRKFLEQAVTLAEKYSFSTEKLYALSRKITAITDGTTAANPPANHPGPEQQVEPLLVRAKKQIAAYKLLSPTGDNAVDTLRHALQLAPDSKVILDTLATIAQKYGELAQKEQRNNNFSKAEKRVNQGLQIAREFHLPSKKLETLRQTIQAARKAYPQFSKYLAAASKALADNNPADAEKFLAKADLLAGKYSFPQQELEQISEQIHRQQQKLAEYKKYISLARRGYENNDLAAGRQYIDQAAAIAGEQDLPTEELESLRAKINRKPKRHRSFGIGTF